MLSIKSSLMSENSARKLNNSSKTVGRSLERLSSGLRINGASDDAAGLSVSTRMNTQIRESTQLIKNVNDTASLAHGPDDSGATASAVAAHAGAELSDRSTRAELCDRTSQHRRMLRTCKRNMLGTCHAHVEKNMFLGML